MAETIQEQIRRHQREREAQGMPSRSLTPKESDEKYETEAGFHGGLLAQISGRLHPAEPFDHTRLHGAGPSLTPLYPTTGGDPTQKPNYDPPPKPAPPPQEPIERPRARSMAGDRPAAPLQPRHARHEDVVRELTKEVRPRPAAANANPPAQPKAPQQAARQFSVHGGRWVANGHATTYDPASGRVRIWIPGENRGLNVSLDSLDPESQQFVTGNTRQGRVGDLADGYHNQQGVLHFDRLEPGEMGAPPLAAAPKPAAPAAPRPAAPGGRPAAGAMPEVTPVVSGAEDATIRPVPPAAPRRPAAPPPAKPAAPRPAAGMMPEGDDGPPLDRNAMIETLAHQLAQNGLDLWKWGVPENLADDEDRRNAERLLIERGAIPPRPVDPPAAPARAPAPARRPAGEMPGAPVAKEGRPGPIAPPAPKGPAPRVDPTKPPEPGFNRFRTRDGAHAFDGQIVSYDPDTGTVKIQTPSGHKVSIEYGYLDDDSKSLFEGRVAEHNEKVEFEDEREDFDDKHGKGAHENRFAPEMAFPEHRGADGMGGARLAARRRMERDAARQREVDAHNAAMGVTPEPGPVADVPPAARAAAEAAAPQDDAVARAERRLAEKKERLRQLELAEPRDLARTGELRNGPADLERLQRELDAARAGVGRPAAVPPKRNETPDHIVEARKRNRLRAEEEAANPWLAQEREWKRVVMEYRRNIRHFKSENISLDDYAAGRGVDTTALPDDVYEAGVAATSKAAEHQARQENAANAHANTFLSPAARMERAQRVLRDPNATPHARAAAYVSIGQTGMAQQELVGHAAITAAKHQADAEATRANAGRPGAEPPPPQLQTVVDGAMDSLPEDASYDERKQAAIHAVRENSSVELTDKEAEARAVEPIQAWYWRRLKGGNVRPGTPEWHFFWSEVVQRNGENAGAKESDRKPPRTKEEFIELAGRHGIPASTALLWYGRLTKPADRDTTQVGVPDEAALTV